MVQTNENDRGRLWLWLPGLLLTVAGFTAAWVFMEPAPPRKIVIATGRPDGAYHAFGEAYRAELAEHGIDLEVRVTAGSLENYELLADDPDVHLAIVQGGTAPRDVRDADRLEALSGLYVEPVWIFVRTDANGDVPADLGELNGRRIAVGPEGSGTRAIAEELLHVNGVEDNQPSPTEDRPQTTELLPVGGSEAVAALRAGDVDAAFFVISAAAPLVRELTADDGIRPLGIARNEAYRRRLPYLSATTLPEGVIDFERNLPRSDLPMVAPVASLVASPELHEAFVPLLLDAVAKVHADGDLLTEPGTFPSTVGCEFPVNAAAQNWFESGTSFLYRWLPFWIASAVDRGKILLLPAVTLLLPLVKVFPPVIRWRIRSSIYRWYADLREIDQALRDKPAPEQSAKLLERIAVMQRELDDVSVPLSYMEEFYNLRLHIDLVRRALLERIEGAIDGANEESQPRIAAA